MMMMMIKICGGERAVWKMNAKRRNKVKAATQQRSYHEHVLLVMHMYMYCTYIQAGWRCGRLITTTLQMEKVKFFSNGLIFFI